MNSQKLVLMAVAVVATGIFALPSTVSLFSGQHSWYDLSGGPNDVPCEKCHADIADEMISTGAHSDLTCSMCHRTLFTGYGYARVNEDTFVGPQGTTPGKEAHAASTVECMDCHGLYRAGTTGSFPENHCQDPEYAGQCMKCHQGGWTDFISAGGFGLADPTGRNPGKNSTDTDTGEKAAHKQFVLDSIDEPLMEGANEACIACHTRVGVNITWTKNEYLEFTATEDSGGNWTIPGFAAGGENVTQVNTSNEWTT